MKGCKREADKAGRHMERIARPRLAPRNKKGDKRRQKGDKPDTVTETQRRQGGHNDQQEEKQEGRQKETEGSQDGHSDQ